VTQLIQKDYGEPDDATCNLNVSDECVCD